MKPAFIGMCVRPKADAVHPIRWTRSTIRTTNTLTWSVWSIEPIKRDAPNALVSEFACTRGSLFLKWVLLASLFNRRERTGTSCIMYPTCLSSFTSGSLMNALTCFLCVRILFINIYLAPFWNCRDLILIESASWSYISCNELTFKGLVDTQTH